MYVSNETTAHTEARLRGVLSSAELRVLPGEFAFVECPVTDFPHALVGEALASVRDHEVWSALIPSSVPAAERFVVFSFHFTPGQDNSGFVGWLASNLKRLLGTGVFVVCGQNSHRGGVFDYWGAPAHLREQVLEALSQLRRGA
ncbi:MAG: DUF6196 family protein [Gemmatimonas sp.]|uniref:DUF6196 family protein n=1 Tax=Gemmatimonas sp. TaxID=1962908 RepID=UPI00391F289D